MQTNHSQLNRVLGPWTATAVIVGAVIGSGIFAKPQWIAQNVGSVSVALSVWLLGGLLALCGSLTVAELGAARPKAGGNYVYLREAYGPVWGFLWGWVEFWIVRTGSIAALTTMFSQTVFELAGLHANAWDVRWLSIIVIVALGTINILGVQWGGLFQNLTTWFKVLALIALACLPLFFHADSIATQAAGPYEPRGGIVGFGAALLGVLWSYSGWISLACLGEELKDPARNVPRVMALGMGLIALLYLAINLAYFSVLPIELMADASQVRVVGVSFIEKILAGQGSAVVASGVTLISVIIMVSVIGSANVDMMTGPRTYFAMGRDGLLHRALSTIHLRFRTPSLSIILQMLWSITLILGSDLIRQSPHEDPFDTLTNYVVFAMIIFEMMVVGAVFRYRRLNLERENIAYRAFGYPYVGIFYLIVMGGVLINTLYTEPKKSLVGLGFLACGVLWHTWQTRWKRKT